MKISVVCDSLLLSDALENFLKEYLSPYIESDIVVTDKFLEIEKPIFMIGRHVEANLSKPFTKSTLLLKLEEFYDSLKYDIQTPIRRTESSDDLKQKIDALCMRFSDELHTIITEHYGK